MPATGAVMAATALTQGLALVRRDPYVGTFGDLGLRQMRLPER